MKAFQTIKRTLGVTANELTLMSIVLLGLLIGIGYKYLVHAGDMSDVTSQEIYAILDSIADVDKTTYIGIDQNKNSIADLKTKDTVKLDGKIFKNKKQLPQEGERINLNLANKKQLMKLPSIGAKTADNIIEYRKEYRFQSIEDIMEIKGIGTKKFEKMKKYLEI